MVARQERRGLLKGLSMFGLAGLGVAFVLLLVAFWRSPYQEARCRLEAGDLGRARERITRFRLEKGPLGARLSELSGAPMEATR